MLKFVLFSLIAPFLLLPANTVISKEITTDSLIYLTEDYPPHNYMEKGRLKGASVEILQLLWKKLGIPDKTSSIEMVPWARGMSMIKHKPNIVLFSMGSSKERATQLHWVGPYYSHPIGLIGRKSAHYNIKTLNDAKNLKIGAVRDDIGNSILLDFGFPQSSLELSNNQNSLFLKLKYNRINFISYSKSPAFEGMKKAGLNPDEYEMVYEIIKSNSGFGFSKQVPQQIIDDFQHALEDLVKNGAVKKVLLKYKLLTE